MPGVKGAGGPVPKRSSQRRRRNTPAAGEPTTAEGAAEVEQPKANSQWHPVAKRWFDSLAASGQSRFYEPSDWAAAYLLAESMSRELKPQPLIDADGKMHRVSMPPKAASVAAWLKGMTALLVTEGDRRRAALELDRSKPAGEEGGADVTHLDDIRRRLHSAG